MAVLEDGTTAWTEYMNGGGNGLGLMQERLICGHVTNADYLICTPSFEYYVETLSPGNVDLHSLRVSSGLGVIPAGVDPNNVFVFRVLTVL